jgi:hypothetical protein
MNNRISKCSFCRYWTGCSCMVTPNSRYCKEATDEFYRHFQNIKNTQPAQKSLRSWDKR